MPDPTPPAAAITVLAIETSGRGGGVAIVRAQRGPGMESGTGTATGSDRGVDGAGTGPSPEAILDGAAPACAVLATRAIDPATRHGQALLPAIEAVLADARLDKRDLGLIACGLGPGSYTSLRIGLSMGRTLAYALSLPVHGAASFDVLALGLPRSHPGLIEGVASVLVAVDAYRGEVYVARYRVERRAPSEAARAQAAPPPRLVRIGEITAVPPADALLGLEPPVLVVGDGPSRYPEAFAVPAFADAAVGAAALRLAPVEAAVPEARCLAALAASAWLAGVRQSPRDVLPLYLRPALPEPARA